MHLIVCFELNNTYQTEAGLVGRVSSNMSLKSVVIVEFCICFQKNVDVVSHRCV